MGLEYGVIEFDLEVDFEAVKGIQPGPFVPSSTTTGRLIRINRLGTFCSTIPAAWIRNTNGAALPSMIGTSEALSST